METVRQEMGLGVNRFLQLAGIAKATYYRRKQGSQARPCPVQQQIVREVSTYAEQHHKPLTRGSGVWHTFCNRCQKIKHS
jgi:hypothetical protein